jgi:NADH-quinone oxidoreductase subunit J
MVIAFYIAGIVAVIASIMVITRLNAVHALLYLIVSLLAVAVAFYILGAPFAAALEVIIYAGAIMVFLLFVIMLLNLGPAATNQERQWLSAGMWIGPGILALVLVVEFIYITNSSLSMTSEIPFAGAKVIPAKRVGESLFSTYLLGVELAGMLLLAGLVGAFHIGRRVEK